MLDRIFPSFERASPGDLPELMDRPDCGRDALGPALDALARVNRLSGQQRMLWPPLRRSLGSRDPGPLRILDVGAGGGDAAASLLRRFRARGWTPSFVLADLHPETLRLGRQRLRERLGPRRSTAFRFVRLTAPSLPFRTESFDLAFSTITLHHLERPEAVAFLRDLSRVTGRGWVIVDLRRSRLAYLAVRALAATLWRRNPLPRRDGPVSVRRAFTVEEARELLREAGVPGGTAEAGGLFRLRIRGGRAA